MRLVLDAEAVNALLDPRHPAERKVRRAMEAARRLRREVAIATGTLAELYRGAGRNQALDALLARESGDGLLLRDTDRTLARLIGALLTEAGASSALFADAHPVAVAVEAGGGVVQTADPDDLGRLAAPYRTVVIEPLSSCPTPDRAPWSSSSPPGLHRGTDRAVACPDPSPEPDCCRS